MIFFGFDCAIKSLGWSILNIDIENIPKFIEEFKYVQSALSQDNLLELLRDEEFYGKLTESILYCTDFLGNFIKIVSGSVLNLIGDEKVKETNTVELARQLNHFLKNTFTFAADHIVIEKQYSKFSTISGIECQLCMYFAEAKNVYCINSSLKNKLNFDSDSGKYKYFKDKYSTSYKANKEFAKHNMSILLEVINRKDLLEDIKKSNHADIADSILSIFAYVKKYSLISREFSEIFENF